MPAQEVVLVVGEVEGGGAVAVAVARAVGGKQRRVGGARDSRAVGQQAAGRDVLRRPGHDGADRQADRGGGGRHRQQQEFVDRALHVDDQHLGAVDDVAGQRRVAVGAHDGLGAEPRDVEGGGSGVGVVGREADDQAVAIGRQHTVGRHRVGVAGPGGGKRAVGVPEPARQHPLQRPSAVVDVTELHILGEAPDVVGVDRIEIEDFGHARASPQLAWDAGSSKPVPHVFQNDHSFGLQPLRAARSVPLELSRCGCSDDAPARAGDGLRLRHEPESRRRDDAPCANGRGRQARLHPFRGQQTFAAPATCRALALAAQAGCRPHPPGPTPDPVFLARRPHG